MSAPAVGAPSADDRIPALDRLGDQFSLAAARTARDRRPSPRVSWPSVLVPALVALVIVMGVSSRLTTPADAQVVRAARDTIDADTGGFTLTTTLVPAGAATAGSVPPSAGQVLVSSSGSYDRSTGLVQSTVDLAGAAGAAGAGPAAALGGAAGQVDAIGAGSVLYLRSPLFARALPPGTGWVKVDTTKLPPGSLLAAATGPGGLSVPDPAGLLDVLSGVGPDTRAVGREELAGVAVTHYRGTVDALDPATGASSREALVKLGFDLSTDAMPYDVWVDDQSHVRRLSLVQFGPAGAVTVTVDYHDVGRSAAIEVPPADQVVDLTALVGRTLSGSGGALGLGGH
jgi:hypothetical protein